MSMAFVDMNPFPLRQIQNRRTFHLEKVRLELTELEAIRQTFLRERDTTLDGRTLISDDEEDSWTTANKRPDLQSRLANHSVSYTSQCISLKLWLRETKEQYSFSLIRMDIFFIVLSSISSICNSNQNQY